MGLLANSPRSSRLPKPSPRRRFPAGVTRGRAVIVIVGVIAAASAPAVSAVVAPREGGGEAVVETSAPPPFAVGDRVWADANANGVYDEGEPGVDGVVVELRRGDDTYVGTATTSGGGWFGFANLDGGQYYLVFDPTTYPPGVDETAPDVGDEALDSDVDVDLAVTEPFDLRASSSDWDLGLRPTETGTTTTSTTTTSTTTTSTTTTSTTTTSTTTTSTTSASSETTTTTETTTTSPTTSPTTSATTSTSSETTTSAPATTTSAAATTTSSPVTTTTMTTTISPATTTTSKLPTASADELTGGEPVEVRGGGMCPNPGSRNAPSAQPLRVKIVEPATGVRPGSGGLVHVVADVDLADWRPFRGTDLPADYSVFDLDASLDLSGDGFSGLQSIPTQIYCYSEDAGVDKPARGYIELDVPWGGGIGPWTGIAAVMRTHGGIVINGDPRPNFGGDRVTVVGGDHVLAPGSTVTQIAGARIDQNLFTVLSNRLEVVSRTLVWRQLNDAIEGSGPDDKYSLSMKSVNLTPNVTLALSNPAGTGGRLHVDVDLTNVDIRVSVADPPLFCPDFDAVVKADRIRVVGDLDITGAGSAVMVNVNNFDTDIDGLSISTAGAGAVCGTLLNGFGALMSLAVSTVHGQFGDFAEEVFAGIASEAINDSISGLTSKLNLTFSSLAADPTGLVAIFDGVVPAAGIVIDPGIDTLLPLSDVITTTAVGNQPIDVGLYVSPVAISLMAASLGGTSITTVADNGAPSTLTFGIAPYATFDGTQLRFNAPDLRFTANPPPGAPFPGPHLRTVTDYKGFGTLYPEINPATGEFALKVQHIPADCTAVCPTTMLWATTDPILVPLGHVPNFVGGKVWERIVQKLDTVLGSFTRWGDPVNLELAFVEGQGVGANAFGYFALYGYVRPMATIDVTGPINTTTTPAPWTTGVWMFYGEFPFSTSGFVGPVTVTASTSGCTHNPLNLVVMNNKVTYSTTIYFGSGGGIASCTVHFQATSPSGQLATASRYITLGV